MTDVTRILTAIEQGDSKAADNLLPLVYRELCRLAAQKMSLESPGQTLQATALVHEAYIRLVGSGAQNWNSRTHFFCAAAEAMRRILIDKARRKQRIRRGGGWVQVSASMVLAYLPAPALSQRTPRHVHLIPAFLYIITHCILSVTASIQQMSI